MSGPTGGDQTEPLGSRSAVAPQADIDPWLPLISRLVIAGVPSAGKTSLSNAVVQLSKAPLRHTDSLIETHKWGEDSAEVALWFDAPGPWIIEGVTCVRALRKWMFGHPKTFVPGHDTGQPCDALVWLDNPLEKLTNRQNGMAKGCRKVLGDIIEELERRGVQILRL